MSDQKPNPSVFDFGQVADAYDAWYESAEGQLYDLLEKRAMQKLIGRVDAGRHLLEMGMGTGWWSLFFSRLGYRVTGVDVAQNMVDVARAKNVPQAEFRVADAHRLPFDDDSFDDAAAITSLEFTRDPEQAVRELVRCTKPGGRLFFGILNSHCPLNIMRQKQAEGPFANARFFSSDELREMLAPYGSVTLKQCAFPSSLELPPNQAAFADDAQNQLNQTTGAFIAVRVNL